MNGKRAEMKNVGKYSYLGVLHPVEVVPPVDFPFVGKVGVLKQTVRVCQSSNLIIHR